MALRRKPIIALTTLLTLAVVTSSGAVPLPGQMGGFGITPARRHVAGRPVMALSPTTVINGTSSRYAVKVFAVLLTQTLSGAFAFAETPRNLNESRFVLTTSPDSFTLASGARRTVSLYWNLLPAGQKWVAIGVVFQGMARGQRGPVHIVTRLLSVNFLRLPGLTHVRGVFTRLYPEQFSPHVLRFLARVKNTGDRFWAPAQGRLAIRDSSGHVVFRESWPGDVVLPGAKRDFPIDVKKVLPAGRYTATVSMNFGGERSRSTTFTLVGPNQLPTPAITIRDFNVNGMVGSVAHVSAQLLSAGTAPASATLHLYLGDAGSLPGARALATSQLAYRALRPGSVIRISHDIGGSLRKGSYRAMLTWTDAGGTPHMLEADFTAAASRSIFQKLWEFLKQRALIFAGLLALALLLAMALAMERLRRRQQQTVAELVAARAKMQAAGVSGGGDGFAAEHARRRD